MQLDKKNYNEIYLIYKISIKYIQNKLMQILPNHELYPTLFLWFGWCLVIIIVNIIFYIFILCFYIHKKGKK